MVESETFVSRRKTTVGRRGQRKLFTARGLVEQEAKNGHHVEILTPERGQTVESTSFVLKEAKPSPRVVRATSSRDEAISFCSSDPSPAGGGNEDESSSSHTISAGDDGGLEDVLQMGCMDGLFFSTNRVEARTKKNEFTVKFPVPRMNFIGRQNMELTMDACRGLNVTSQNFDRSFPKHFGCRLPYRNIGGQVSDRNVMSNFVLPGENRRDSHRAYRAAAPTRNEKNKSEKGKQSTLMQYPMDPPQMSIEAPPSQIYIGEQPCFSEDLIPVDDLPPPCNLTKYHPKPLTLRPNFAFGKPMLSIDSDESEHETQLSEENEPGPSDQRQEKLSAQASFDHNTGPNGSHEATGPSFDNQEPETKLPSFDDDGPSFDKHENNKTYGSFAPAASEASTSGKITMDSGFGIETNSSAAVSVASDEAISSEKPKAISHTGPRIAHPVKPATAPTAPDTGKRLETLGCPTYTNTTAIRSRQLLPMPSASLYSQTDDDESSMALQDENNSPPESPPQRVDHRKGFLEKNRGNQPSMIRMALGTVDLPPHSLGATHSSSLVAASTTEFRRRPFDLRVGTNFPLSPTGNEEFFSPRTTTPKKRNSSRGGEARRFGFENDSFDEAEFFDTAMA